MSWPINSNNIEILHLGRKHGAQLVISRGWENVNFEAELIDGSAFQLAELQGKYVIFELNMLDCC